MFAMLALLACTASDPTVDAVPTLRFSAIPDRDTTLLNARFDPVAAYLSDRMGVPVLFVPATDYSASVEMFKNGDIQLAWFGGLTGVQARRAVPGAHAIAQGLEDPHYYSYFIASNQSGIAPTDTFPTAIADHSFTFGSASSTSGRLMPEHFIRAHTGQGPEDFFSESVGFSGAHDKTALLVASGRIDAGVLSYKTWDELNASGAVDGAHVIWKTPTYADYNFTAHPDLQTTYGPEFTERLQSALVEMRDPALLQALSRTGLIPARDEDFAAIERVALTLDMVR
jgi:phosphonate transport system substrate-binding protein